MKPKSILALLFSLAIASTGAAISAQSTGASVSADLEIGADSYERRYFRPRIQFDFLFRPGNLFFSLDTIQRINGRMRGEVDFWLSMGYRTELSGPVSVETAIRHLCRHITSVDNPKILDINEFIGRAWWKHKSFQLGLGAGTYLGPSDGLSHLLLLNLKAPRILGSEFSLNWEFKWVDGKKILYDIEASLFVSSALDLFVRAAHHYRTNRITYMGFRIKNQGGFEHSLEKSQMNSAVYLNDGDYKVIAGNGFKIRLHQENHIRLILNLSGSIPVLKGHKFFGPFRPEKIIYPISLEYERLLGSVWRLYLYSKYEISMPVDVAEEFKSGLGLGMGFRNSEHFDYLNQWFRLDLQGGRHFSRKYDSIIHAGFCLPGESMVPGIDLLFRRLSDETRVQADIFAEFGDTVKIRPFIGIRWIRSTGSFSSTDTRILAGIRFIHWGIDSNAVRRLK